jgi:glycosyltransferase involved in cell wall biosynthesis
MSARRSMLMLSPEAPWPSTTGGLVRIAGLCSQLARHFDLTFISPRRRDQVLPTAVPARFVCPELPDPGVMKKAFALVDPLRPFHCAMYWRKEIASAVRRELAERPYDVVYSHFIYGAPYLGDLRVPVIVDQQNVDRVYWQNKSEHSPFPIDLFAAWNTRRTIEFETRFLPRIWAYVSVSEDDRQQTQAYAQQQVKHFWVAPNGVDTRRFTPAARSACDPNAVTLGYLGSMALQMNVDAVQRFVCELLPRIQAALQGVRVRFTVIGSAPSPAIRRLARQTSGMSLSGTVDDVVPWLQDLDILVCPLRIGAGTKLKVAEALSCGLPVVGSPLAFAGLPGHSGEHYVVANSDDSFVESVCHLAQGPAKRTAMGVKARQLAEQHLEWDAIGEKLSGEIEGALVNSRGAVA